jgi:hypothetical protein
MMGAPWLFSEGDAFLFRAERGMEGRREGGKTRDGRVGLLLCTLIAAAIGLLSVRTMSTPILNMGIILTGGPLPSREREVLAESQPPLLLLPGLQGC